MKTQRSQLTEDIDGLGLSTEHVDNIDLAGLEELFEWASDTVADGLDNRGRKEREQRIRKQVLSIVHKTASEQAKAKYADEVVYLQRRTIALQGVVNDKLEEIVCLKQIMLGQYYALKRIPELEEELAKLQGMTWYRDEAEQERRVLLAALSKMKSERDTIEEILCLNEQENERLAKCLRQVKEDLSAYKNRSFWRRLKDLLP